MLEMTAKGYAMRTVGKSSETGFTLLELSMVVGLVGVVAVTLMGALLSTVKVDGAMREREEAMWAVRSQLEQVVAWPDFGSLVTQWDGFIFAIGSLEGSQGPGTLPGRVEVDDSDPDLVRVTVRADWAGTYDENSFELSTLVSDSNATIVVE